MTKSLLRTYRHESRFTLAFALICLILIRFFWPSDSANAERETEPVFRITLMADPSTLDPQMLNNASGNYLITLLRRGLYRYSDKSELLEDEGGCSWENSLLLKCKIHSDAKWSDGSKVMAQDYLRAFEFLIDPRSGASQADLLYYVKNAEKIHQNKLSVKSLGVQILSEREFAITFERPDSEFLYKLLHPALYPRHSTATESKSTKFKNDESVSNGAFRLSEVQAGVRYVLNRNKHFEDTKNKNLIHSVEALVIDSDSTSLQLFESGKIHLLRRLPVEEFPRFLKSKAFHQFPVLRFDYIGFSNDLKPFKTLRKNLAQGFDPAGFQSLFATDGKPGCPPLPSRFYNGNACYKRAAKLSSISWPSEIKPVFGFSQMGGEDIRRGVEWFQGQWRSDLKINLELQSREQKMFLAWLKAKPPALFRKGLSLNRPTCLAALETFSKDNAENFIGFKNERFEKILKSLS